MSRSSGKSLTDRRNAAEQNFRRGRRRHLHLPPLGHLSKTIIIIIIIPMSLNKKNLPVSDTRILRSRHRGGHQSRIGHTVRGQRHRAADHGTDEPGVREAARRDHGHTVRQGFARVVQSCGREATPVRLAEL